LIRSAVETIDGLSQNWFVAAIQLAYSTEQRKVKTTSSTRIAAGLILGLGCFSAVLTGGIFVGQTIGEALSMLQTIAPVEVDPLR
jgi:F0F1-type ATP synthase membrane subunit c/vacuolar-type H+-ATPase subunit K